jgi:hypothetical protein
VAIQGSIEEAGLPDVLQLLALGRKTGCLSVVDGSVLQGQIYLDVGRVSYATVSSRPDRLGDILVKSGRITRQQLDHAIAEQKREGSHQLGRILVEAGRIERAELEQYIRLQVEEAVYHLFTWKQGTFSFTSDRLPPYQSLLVPLDTESLLLEGARRVDEWSLIQRKIPSFDLIYKRSRESLSPAVEGLTEEQKRILPLLDGTLDVNGLVDTTGMAEFDVGKAMYGLVTAGLVQLVERRAHVRHLEYRELLAYAVREAEFADAQRRKDAARHIVDCPICAERLRTMHIRSTTGATPIPRGAEQTEASLAVSPLPPESKRAHAGRGRAGGTPAGQERRVRERRAGADRRKRERRTGIDRRVGPRREEDQQAPDTRERKVGGKVQPGDVGAPPVAATASPASGAPGPDRAPPPVAGGEAGSGAAAPPANMPAAAQAGSVVAGAGASAGGSDLATPAGTAAVSPGPEAAAARQGGPPGSGREGAPGGIEWVVSPEESLEMLRGPRTQARSPDAVRRGKTAAQAGGGAVNHARAVGANGAAAAEGGARDPLSGAAPTLDRYAAGSHQARAAEARRRDGQDAVRQSYPVKRLAIAAGIVFVAVLGFMAGQFGGRGGATQLATGAAAAEPSPAAGAPAQSPAAVEESAAHARGEAAAAESVTQGAAAAPQAPAARSAPPLRVETPARRVAEPSAPTRERQRPTTPVAAPPAQPPAESVAPVVQAPPPAPTAGVVRGVVRDAGGRVLPGARVAVRGTALSAVADGSGAFEIRDVPGGRITVLASADGFVSGSAAVEVQAGATVTANIALNPPAAAAEPDEELAAGGWARVDRAEATTILGGTLGAIDGLPIESISKSTTAGRPRVRVAQLTQAGERIVLTETRAGAAVRGAGPVVVTALRVMPASDAYPWSTASVSFGNVLITVKTKVATGTLRSMLDRLSEVPQSE